MANPRQRRKNRSSTGKIKTSKASTKNKHKVIVKGPALLTENWDKSKTVRQNLCQLHSVSVRPPTTVDAKAYTIRASGYLAKDRIAGGIEPVEGVPYAITSATLRPTNIDDLTAVLDAAAGDSDSDSDTQANISKPAAVEKVLAKGEGRIVRDSEGKIIGIVMGGEDGIEIEESIVAQVRGADDSDSDDEDDEEEDVDEEEQKQTPWGNEMEDWDGEGSQDEEMQIEAVDYYQPRSVGQGIPIGAKREIILPKTDIVAQLEVIASRSTKIIRHTSDIENGWLIDMIAKYGDDVDSMSKDRKVNVWQKTQGEINRAIKKAGGFEKLATISKRLAMQGAAAAAEALLNPI